MGDVIEYSHVGEAAASSRLLVYIQTIQKMFEPKSLNKELAEELLKCNLKRRSMKLEQIFNTVLDRYPEDVTIKDIDVMFNPEYQVDVLKILIAARKRKRYSVIWPGSYEDGKLIYGEEGYPDYKVFEVADYDITFVKVGGSANEVFRTYQL